MLSDPPMLTPARRSSASFSTVFTFGPVHTCDLAYKPDNRPLRLTDCCNNGCLERRSKDKHHIGSVRFNHLAKKFCRLCGLRRGSRIKSGIPFETRTNGICGEERRHNGGRLNDLVGAEVDREETRNQRVPGFIADKLG